MTLVRVKRVDFFFSLLEAPRMSIETYRSEKNSWWKIFLWKTLIKLTMSSPDTCGSKKNWWKFLWKPLLKLTMRFLVTHGSKNSWWKFLCKTLLKFTNKFPATHVIKKSWWKFYEEYSWSSLWCPLTLMGVKKLMKFFMKGYNFIKKRDCHGLLKSSRGY